MRRPCLLMSGIRSAVIFAATMVMTAPAAAQQQTGSQQKPGAAASQPTKVDLQDVSRHPEKYLNKTVTVEGETLDVLGPHLFVIDEPRWFHLWGGMLVVVPEPFAAMVRRDAPVRVTGTVEKVVLADAKRKWSFLGDPKIEVDLFEKPVIVANEVTTMAPAIVSLKFQPGQPVGTSGSNAAAPITDIKQLAQAADSTLVGRRVDINGTVVRTDGDGFWIKTASGEEVFVVPASKTSVRAGQSAGVQGIVLETPRSRKSQTGSGRKQPVYVYADRVTPK